MVVEDLTFLCAMPQSGGPRFVAFVGAFLPEGFALDSKSWGEIGEVLYEWKAV